MKIGVIHMGLMIAGVIGLIWLGIALNKANKEIKSKDVIIAGLTA